MMPEQLHILHPIQSHTHTQRGAAFIEINGKEDSEHRHPPPGGGSYPSIFSRLIQFGRRAQVVVVLLLLGNREHLLCIIIIIMRNFDHQHQLGEE
jgi:hypothetical protein